MVSDLRFVIYHLLYHCVGKVKCFYSGQNALEHGVMPTQCTSVEINDRLFEIIILCQGCQRYDPRVRQFTMLLIQYARKTWKNKYFVVDINEKQTCLICMEHNAASKEDKFLAKVKILVAFSIAIDESTDITGMAQLDVFVRGVNKDIHISQEFEESILMNDTATEDDNDEFLSETDSYQENEGLTAMSDAVVSNLSQLLGSKITDATDTFKGYVASLSFLFNSMK
ncbi:hypothetical protein RF11_08496 [Thelohanellus kitauei]|uniref:DUF4371 domain-containing protein n=1 Tax=Thelohanellus kitauei TaxID=669202 RepID=A0A0C2JRD3_THEKT|nr:hypothetical protein RF11_08496 [Thelohanellus kitauei]